MKILGISGSPRKESQSGVYQLVQTVLENTGLDYEIVSLRKKSISGCIACLGCVKDNVCQVGIPSMIHGNGVKITPEMIPDVAKQPKVMAAAVAAGKLLGQRLNHGHDRRVVTQNMQKKMMAMFASAV